MAQKILRQFPPHKVYVEVFGGAASVLIAKQPSQIEVYNDSNGLLVNLFETIRNKPTEFLERTKGIVYSRLLYETWRKEITQAPPGVDTAVKTLYCLLTCFIGDVTKGWAFQKTNNDGGPSRWLNVQDRVLMLTARFRHVAIDHLDFRDCIKNWDSRETFFFLDPPYLTSKSHGWYGNNFKLDDHEDLAKILASVKAKWLLTLDDAPELRRLYNRYSIRRISSKLSSEKVEKGERRVDLAQIIVSNYSLEENKQRLIQSVAG